MNPDPQRQKGAALFVALVALLAMTFAGLALLRSMDSAGLIAGNFSFRQAALSAADMGLEGALSALETTYIGGRSSDQNCATGSGTCYLAWYKDAAACTNGTDCDNANGVSQRINWANVAATNINFASLGTGYSYQYVIERLCSIAGRDATTGDVLAGDVAKYCFSMTLTSGSGKSYESRSALYGKINTVNNEVAFRTTIRVSGPHNASTMIQTLFMKSTPAAQP